MFQKCLLSASGKLGAVQVRRLQGHCNKHHSLLLLHFHWEWGREEKPNEGGAYRVECAIGSNR